MVFGLNSILPLSMVIEVVCNTASSVKLFIKVIVDIFKRVPTEAFNFETLKLWNVNGIQNSVERFSISHFLSFHKTKCTN